MKKPKPNGQSPFTLDGQLLIAMPSMSDKRFAGSVIYMCAHSEDGAMGLIINQKTDDISFPDLLDQLNIDTDLLDEAAMDAFLDMSVHIGGPVEGGRGFVLHSDDYVADDSTLVIKDGICLTTTLDILKAIALGNGPSQVIMALGYAGWAPGQLEAEIQANGWLHCPGDAALVFDPDTKLKYQRAMSKIGIDPSHLVNDAGHA